jgi:glycosyltransferase involved in cell wall biosynthesis
MRILKVHNYYLQPGGEDTVFQAETNLLRNNGHVVIEYREFNQQIGSMSQAHVALQTIWSTTATRKMKRILQKEKPDLVHFHNTFPLISPAAYYVCREFEIPVLQTLDNQRLICPAASFFRDGKLCLDCLGKTPPWPAMVHACYHGSHIHTGVVASMLTIHRWLHTWKTKVDVFLSSTNFYRDMFIRAGLPEEKIRVLPHFIPAEPKPSTKNTTGDYALFIGRLDPEKGIRTLLEAWRHVNIPLEIRGSGQLEDQARTFVREHGLNQIHFLGRLEDDELSELIRGARFLIVPSEGYYETFGMVIIEAYCRKVPVIASSIGVLPEMVIDHETGLLFEAGNPIDLAQKVRWLWDHPDESSSMGERSYLEYKQKYTADRGYQILHDVYVQTITSKKIS